MATQYTAVQQNPVGAFRFSVSFAGSANDSIFAQAGFSRISGINASADTIMYREGGQISSMRKFPGLTQYSDVTMERGATSNMDMYTWLSQAIVLNPNSTPLLDNYTGTSFRRSLTVTGYDADFVTVTRNWVITDAWPREVNLGDFDATSSTYMVERMVVVHEGLTPVAGPIGSGTGTAGVGQSVAGVGFP